MAGEDDGGVISENASSESSRIRIFVGGLGGSVTEIDLRNTFSSTQMGLVDSVEIVRSKGRSFAYLDFVPYSDKGLSKLFSKYNGCSWKGGKLKLEKAKEHYSMRMKREWAEDTAIQINPEVNNVDNKENSPPKKLLKTDDSEKICLQLFFPRLKKIKQIPFKGTGKHKYSFQRITVPAFPSHFCDCDEHSGSFKLACQQACTYSNKEGVGMNKNELDTMNSVLSKILAREVGMVSCNLTNSGDDTHVSDTIKDRGSNDMHVSYTEEDKESDDDDNLIINMVAGGNDRISFSDIKDIYANTVPNKGFQASKNVPDNNVPTSYKKRKAISQENDDGDGLYFVNTETKNVLDQNSDRLKILPHSHAKNARKSDHEGERSTKSPWKHLKSDNVTFHISDITKNNSHEADLEGKSDNNNNNNNNTISVSMENKKFKSFEENEKKSVDVVPDATPEIVAEAKNKNVTRNTWVQKSPWMQLVGEPSNSSFCISQVLSGLNSENQELLQMKKFNESSIINEDMDVSLSQTRRNEDNTITDHSKKDISGVTGGDPLLSVKPLQDGNIIGVTTLVKRNPSKVKQASRGGGGGGVRVDPNSFVRSAASMKEWKKAKEALSRSLK